MRRISLIIFTLLFSLIALSQNKTEVYFGISGRSEWARNIIELYDNGYHITGGIEDNVYNKGWNIKTDINLEQIYDKVIEHSQSSISINGSVADKNGNIYICGSAEIMGHWPFVTKLDSCGEKVWCKILNYENEFDNGSCRDILISENSILLLTRFDSEEEINMIHIIGLSFDGDVLWKKPYASKDNYPWINDPSCSSFLEFNDEYYITGHCYWPYPDDTTHFFLRPLFIGIDSLFDEKWILPFYPLDSIFGVAFKTIPLNDSVFMGVGARTVEYQGLLMFYNNNGEELGYHGISNDQIGPNINGSDIRDVARINDTLFMTASLFGSEFGGNPGGEFTVSLNGIVYNYNSRPNTIVPKLIKTYDNYYVIATSIKETNPAKTDIYVYKIDDNLNDVPFDPTPHTYDSLCPGGIQSSTIDLTSCFVWTDISEAPSPGEYYASLKTIPIKAYPNPVTGSEITFEYEHTEYHSNMELKCFDIFGEEVFKEKVYIYQGKSIVDISGWGKGMYFAVVYSDGKPIGQTKFVVK